MANCNIKGVNVKFPFEPYELQKNYMEKVIECIQNGVNGVLESPTGTGKTLSLLCSSLGWLEVKKAQIQLERKTAIFGSGQNEYLDELQGELDMQTASANARGFLGVPTIIYASRTHSQLSQAMNELKRTAYSYMKSCVIGSREQLCIHPDVTKEQNNALKIHLCRMKVKTRSCHFYNKVDKFKENPEACSQTILDIEDLVNVGQNHKVCPYYLAKQLKQSSDIVFMPYNYLLDPKARKALGVDLTNNIIILDEAHNVEKLCEDTASIQIKTTDITLCIDEITAVMKAFTDEVQAFNDSDVPKDFTADELCILKQMFLDFEKEFDKIELKNPQEGTTFEGNFIYELFEKAGIHTGNQMMVRNMIEKIIQFLTTATAEGPFQRKGNGLQLFGDLLTIAFQNTNVDFKQKINKCYKVHITVEESKGKSRSDNWLTKATTKAGTRTLSFWCFSPGFGMNMLTNQGVHCVILTSGTLAPLRPLISELELSVDVRLENPHIIKGDQVCVKILTQGPDGEALNCNYQNRDNPKYISSLGRSISNLVRVIPDGVLIFFPSYPIMQKCQQLWQETGIWGMINSIKSIYVEPKDKVSFNNAINEYYSKIKDPNLRGAIFMGVCRGKVSEGLDFADMNGRAVFITGLPYPPLKDARVILKKRYLDVCNSNDKEYLKGDEWYSLEASRAVNQAIGRVIRHRHDYGVIILLDSRFNNPRIKNQMSLWLRNHIKVVQNFGEIIRDIRLFFRNAESHLPKPDVRSIKAELEEAVAPITQVRPKGLFDFTNSSAASTSQSEPKERVQPLPKRMKITVVPNSSKPSTQTTIEPTSIREFIVMVKKALDIDVFKQFVNAMTSYRAELDFKKLIDNLDNIFISRPRLRYIIPGIQPYIKDQHKQQFEEYCEKMK